MRWRKDGERKKSSSSTALGPSENAVTCFQEDNDLTPDGIVGPDTMGSLLGC